MINQIEFVVHCPLCGLVYRQEVAAGWEGKTRVVRRGETALHALCVENRQGTEQRAWVGVAWCAECSLTKVPGVLKGALKKWLEQGERPCGS